MEVGDMQDAKGDAGAAPRLHDRLQNISPADLELIRGPNPNSRLENTWNNDFNNSWNNDFNNSWNNETTQSEPSTKP
jgi:hypothetical protein